MRCAWADALAHSFVSPSILHEKGGRIYLYNSSIRGIIQKIAVIQQVQRYQDRVCVVFTFVKSWLISMQHSFIEPISHLKHDGRYASEIGDTPRRSEMHSSKLSRHSLSRRLYFLTTCLLSGSSEQKSDTHGTNLRKNRHFIYTSDILMVARDASRFLIFFKIFLPSESYFANCSS